MPQKGNAAGSGGTAAAAAPPRPSPAAARKKSNNSLDRWLKVGGLVLAIAVVLYFSTASETKEGGSAVSEYEKQRKVREDNSTFPCFEDAPFIPLAEHNYTFMEFVLGGQEGGEGDHNDTELNETERQIKQEGRRLGLRKKEIIQDRLYHLFPPKHRAEWDLHKLEELLSYGERVPGTDREAVLHYFLREAFLEDPTVEKNKPQDDDEEEGGKKIDENFLFFSKIGEMLVKESGYDQHYRHDVNASERVWSYEWDNFTHKIPTPIDQLKKENNTISEKSNRETNEVEFQNLIFHFKGGSRFRQKRQKQLVTQTTRKGEPISVCASKKKSGGGTPEMLFSHAIREAIANTTLLDMQFDYLVLAAHWDTKFFKNQTFLGASDSSVPVQYLLRLIKNIQTLSKVAETLAQFYETAFHEVMEDMKKNHTLKYENGTEIEEIHMEDYAVPGRTVSFTSRPLEEVQTKLKDLLSPAHYMLMVDYFFAPYESLFRHNGQEFKFRNKDIRVYLDLVQQLPEMSFVLFDGEEAFETWKEEDNTYGSRHLSQKWKEEVDEDGCSRFERIDLFFLLDLMGPAGTQYPNFFPSHSGLSYASLVDVESQFRVEALEVGVRMKHLAKGREDPSVRIPSLWETFGAPMESFTLGTIPRSVRNAVHTDLKDTFYHREIYKEWKKILEEEKMLAEGETLKPKVGKTGMTVKELNATATLQCRHERDQIQVFSLFCQNIFFPIEEKNRTMNRNVMDDDHKHWLETGRVLHAIAMPFPSVWHTREDDAAHMDPHTMTDFQQILWNWLLFYGVAWR